MRTRIKICGLTRLEDQQAAVAAGADAVGLVMVPASPRFIALQHAVMMRAQLPPFVQLVVLLMNAEPNWQQEVIAALQPDLVQFHGTETPEQCAAAQRPYLKAIAMGEGGVDLAQCATRYADAAGLLLDGHGAGEMGGSGQRFDWREAVEQVAKPLILAGGLNPGNVAQAVTTARPYGVDVSSGVESAPGIKDHRKIQQFIEEVRQADVR